ncbi:MAG: M23 family metallopeptidase [Patescibacteria group bacterium]
MPKLFRHITLAFLRFLVRLLTGLGKGIALAGRRLYRSLSSSTKIVSGIKGIMVRLYETLRTLRANARVIHPQGKIRILLTHPYTLKVIIAGMILLVIFTNINSRSVAADELGHNSLIYRLISIDARMIVVDASPAALPQAGRTFRDTIERENSTNEGIAGMPLALDTSIGTIVRPNPTETLRGSRPRDSIITYTVQQNDTISGIAYRFTLFARTILWANNLSGTSVIRPGDSLVIPQVDGVIHTVRRGDTLQGIATRYRSTIDKITALNNISQGAKLEPGTLLTVPDGRPPSVSVPAQTRVATRTAPRNVGSARSPSGGLIWPTTGRAITQYFSWRHGGLDIDGNLSSPIYAAESGTVEIAQGGWNGGYGNVIVISHSKSTKTRYGHLSRLYVRPGEQVQRGQIIGMMGSTGRSTGSHLHFEILINGARKNPLSYF